MGDGDTTIYEESDGIWNEIHILHSGLLPDDISDHSTGNGMVQRGEEQCGGFITADGDLQDAEGKEYKGR